MKVELTFTIIVNGVLWALKSCLHPHPLTTPFKAAMMRRKRPSGYTPRQKPPDVGELVDSFKGLSMGTASPCKSTERRSSTTTLTQGAPSNLTRGREDGVMRALWMLDERIHQQLTMYSSQKTTQPRDEDVIQDEINWCQNELTRVRNVQVSSIAASTLSRAMVDTLESAVALRKVEHLNVIEAAAKAKTSTRAEVNYYDTRESTILTLKQGLELTVTKDKCFPFETWTIQPLIIACMFMAAVLQLITQQTLRASRYTLRTLEVLVKLKLPRDIRTVRRQLHLDPDVILYAACPSCHGLHRPILSGQGRPSYPARCSRRRFTESAPCGTVLTKAGSDRGQTIRVPMKPFTYHKQASFLSRMTARPGMEEILVEGYERRQRRARDISKELRDVFDGSIVEELVGPNGRPWDDTPSGELRLTFSLSVDFFNPLTNKAGGAHWSAGAMSMVLLELPPSLRYRSENMYLVGVIPGRHEPSLDEINCYLEPLVDEAIAMYEQGIFLSRTAAYPLGRRCRSAIVMIVGDLPGRCKILGCATHNHTIACFQDGTLKKDLNNIDLAKLQERRRTDEWHRKVAGEWKDADSDGKRANLYQKNGVRWSDLLRLRYFQPQKWVVPDPMHTLYLNVVNFHCRNVLGMQVESRAKAPTTNKEPRKEGTDAEEALEKLESRALKVWTSHRTRNKLGGLTIPALLWLCRNQNIQLDEAIVQSRRKKPLIDALLGGAVSTFLIRSHNTYRFILRMNQESILPLQSPWLQGIDIE